MTRLNQMTRRVAKNYLEPLIFLLFCGCSALTTKLENPKVDLKDVGVESANFAEATLLFNFMVQNPNDVAINVDRINYVLKVDGKPFSQGVLEKGLKVDGKSSALVPLPVPIKYSALTQSLSSLFNKGMTPYEIEGSIRLGFISVPFSKAGELSLLDLKQ